MSISDEMLIQKGYNKFILRESMKGIVNEKVRSNRIKKGFNASIKSLINFNDKNIRNYLLDKKSLINEFVDLEKIDKVLDFDLADNSMNKFIFNFINCKLFLDQLS